MPPLTPGTHTHEQWLGLVQPVGLVVALAVLSKLARDFFRVRLWSRKELLEKLFAHYAQLPEEIRLALPLKRLWMVATGEGS